MAISYTITNRSNQELVVSPGYKMHPGEAIVVTSLTSEMLTAKASGYVTIVSTGSNASLVDLEVSTLDPSAITDPATGTMVNPGASYTASEIRTNFGVLGYRLLALENLVKTLIKNQKDNVGS